MDNKKRKNKKTKQSGLLKSLKIFIVLILILIALAGGVVGGMVVSIIKDAPEIDPTKINSNLSQTSTIYDSNENLLEKIDSQSGEYRTFVSLDKMPQYLEDAFIAIEDERFEEHRGIDPKGIVGSLIENFKSDKIERGASTITQQLVKNVYLTSEKKLTRKIKEAYLSLQVEKVLHKDQIMEAYLNRNFFGQNAAGVQEAAQTYFSKDVGELSLAESALFAGIVKSPSTYQPFTRVKPQEYDSESEASIGEMNVLGEKYILVFNEKSVERQRLVLKKMLELEKISQAEYDEALNEDIKAALKPGQKKFEDINSYFTDYVKSQVITTLMNKLDYTKEDAEEALYTGGLKIHSTVNLSLQKELENIYENFTEAIVGNTDNIKGPVLIDWSLNRDGNIIDEKGKTLYYKRDSLLFESKDLVINKGGFNIADNGDLVIKETDKLNPYPKHVDITDYYTIDERKNLVTHTMGSFDMNEDDFSVSEEKSIIISKNYLDKVEDFYKVTDNENLLINEKYFYHSDEGIVQPQSATVILDYKTGDIKAIVGGRDVEGNRLLNRATSTRRQPGSSIKPLSVYLPALDNGYTAATAIDDIPYYKDKGKKNEWFPQNSYTGFKGMRTLRTAVEDSGNPPAIRTVEDIGIETSVSYLEKLGIVNKKNGEKDNFVTRDDDPNKNDEALSPLALGGLTYGLSPLEVTAAYGAIANDGVFVEPRAFTKILDKDGNVLLDNEPAKTTVVSAQTAYIMKDVLRTNVTDGIAKNAQLSNMVTAGKTGTTQDRADIWFVGFTPYYVTGVWIGNDSPKITLSQSSLTAASFWKYINTRTHEGLESVSEFDKPEGIVSEKVCTQSGKLPTSLCYRDPRNVVKTEIFAQGTVPTETCDVHTLITVDTSTNRIANQYCPSSVVANRVYVQRTPPYIPSENDNIIPRDYAYNAPSYVCTVHGRNTWRPKAKPKPQKPVTPSEPTKPEETPETPSDGSEDSDNDESTEDNNNGDD